MATSICSSWQLPACSFTETGRHTAGWTARPADCPAAITCTSRCKCPTEHVDNPDSTHMVVEKQHTRTCKTKALQHLQAALPLRHLALQLGNAALCLALLQAQCLRPSSPSGCWTQPLCGCGASRLHQPPRRDKGRACAAVRTAVHLSPTAPLQRAVMRSGDVWHGATQSVASCSTGAWHDS